VESELLDPLPLAADDVVAGAPDPAFDPTAEAPVACTLLAALGTGGNY